MNKEQRDDLVRKLDEIFKIDIAQVAAHVFADEADMESAKVGRYTLSEYLRFMDKVLRHLKAELESENFHFIPFDTPSAQPIQQVRLPAVIDGILSHLQNKQLPAVGLLDHLITFAGYFGFWRASEYKIHDAAEIDLVARSKDVDLLKSSLSEQLKKLTGERKRVQELEEQMASYFEAKKKELEGITSNLNATTNQKDQVNDLYNQSNELKAKIEATLEVLKKLAEEAKTNKDKSESDFTESLKAAGTRLEAELEELQTIKDELTTHLNETATQQKNFEDAHDRILAEEKFIKGKKEEVVKMTGFMSDATLAHSFHERAKELKTSAIVWAVISGVMTALTIGWIFLLVTDFATNFHIVAKWDSVFVNFLKTSPFFVGLGFALAQYSKERNLREEYTFKAAVALTIKPYTDTLDGTQGNELKQRMIVESIFNLYSKPKSMYIKEGNPTADSIRAVFEFIKGKDKNTEE